MNIFALDDDPFRAAEGHLDKHVVKMIIEYAQLMSTAHRLLDGQETKFTLPDGKKQIINLLEGETAQLRIRLADGNYALNDTDAIAKKTEKYQVTKPICYNASHVNHPCGIWTRENRENYQWLFDLFEACSIEYTRRYGKVHKTWIELGEFLSNAPKNIPEGKRTPFAVAMPEEFKVKDDPIASYKNYYLGPKTAFAKWTNRQPPTWFIASTKDYDASNFERTR